MNIALFHYEEVGVARNEMKCFVPKLCGILKCLCLPITVAKKFGIRGCGVSRACTDELGSSA